MADVTSGFQSSGIVTDVIKNPPGKLLSVTYKGQKLKFNQEMAPTIVKDAPLVEWSAEPNSYYTLCMTDPDAPSRQDPKLREVLHWLVTNIPRDDIVEGDCLAEYIGSGPPQGTGLHRYVFLLYKQSGKLNFDSEKRISKRSGTGRMNFSLQKFAEKYELGTPIAGNMYQAQYDDYVPQLHAQLTE